MENRFKKRPKLNLEMGKLPIVLRRLPGVSQRCYAASSVADFHVDKLVESLNSRLKEVVAAA